eukprot:scaffold6616_cov153-Pinguiococcus_pyrenoidosus.AAC.2
MAPPRFSMTFRTISADRFTDSLVVEHARHASAAASARRLWVAAWSMVVGSSVGCGFSHRPR